MAGGTGMAKGAEMLGMRAERDTAVESSPALTNTEASVWHCPCLPYVIGAQPRPHRQAKAG